MDDSGCRRKKGMAEAYPVKEKKQAAILEGM